MLVEMCCKCGFIHKDDRIMIGDKAYRAYKPHYHWTPADGELKDGDLTFHATVCVACCDYVDWKEFYEQKKKTPEKYKVKYSLNAPLPDRLLSWADILYKTQCNYLQTDCHN
jgi:hypothetical protein